MPSSDYQGWRVSPVVQHLIGHLIGIANRFGQRLYGLVSALARMAARILCLILAHAPAGIARLALPHDPLRDRTVREALECFGVCARQIWVQQWCLSIERRIERDEQHSGKLTFVSVFMRPFAEDQPRAVFPPIEAIIR